MGVSYFVSLGLIIFWRCNVGEMGGEAMMENRFMRRRALFVRAFVCAVH